MGAYKFDMHIHTDESSMCGKVLSADIVKQYKEAGYSGIVITDHYFDFGFACMRVESWSEMIDKLILGYKNAYEVGLKLDFNVILGIELRFPGSMDDFLVYGIDEQFLRENKELHLLGLEGFRELISGKDIMVFQAHPYRLGVGVNPLLLDGVEAYNGKDSEEKNQRAYSFAEQNNLKMIAGSDFHNQEDFARGGIILSENVSTSAELVRALKENKILGLIKK